ncbi:uncharacterized ferritin-like protein (DUF455 family) [Vogesella indigofera]|uniref:Uncharacterized ferritin-like protein (DUF455 family) n=1 Tax=Vogesella indigofera TaxID=45465 RepID=A0A495BJN9_VOGIN|nr:ferritin-like domain-containing protein [Vogesella indigofera]RKQ61111.1 uncharacterized ferritin-like protein (DUF455 family) [Vogesella indigofera]
MTSSLYPAVYQALCSSDIDAKPRLASLCHQQWLAGRLPRAADALPLPHPLPAPGRPARPQLVSPFEVQRQGLGSVAGRAGLIHAIAHIEFNAINLALDAVWRFRDMPDAFVEDWLRVAAEEAKHFNMLRERLQQLGFDYGDFVGHNSLWQMAVDTDHDVMVRMALVPRVLEARGLDAVPPIQKKLAALGDSATVAILDQIFEDEIGHVQIGNYWFTTLCDARGIEPLACFRQLLIDYEVDTLRGAYNWEARRAAGFSEFELAMLEDFAVTRRRLSAGA